MKPGRELDALIAEKVMGWTKLFRKDAPTGDWHGYEWIWVQRQGHLIQDAQRTPPYSTDIAAAWEVVEKLGKIGWKIAISTSSDYGVWISKDWLYDLVDLPDARSDIAPHAICFAALKAVEDK